MVNGSQFNGTTASGPMSWDKFRGWKWHQHKIFEWQHFCFIIFTFVFFVVPWCSVYRLRRGNFARIIIYVYFILFIPVNIMWHRWSLSFCCCYVCFFSLASIFLSLSLQFPLLFAMAKASREQAAAATAVTVWWLCGCCQCHSVQNFSWRIQKPKLLPHLCKIRTAPAARFFSLLRGK